MWGFLLVWGCFLCVVCSFSFVGFGWFSWLSFAGWGEDVEPFLDLENSRKSTLFSWHISKIFSPASFALLHNFVYDSNFQYSLGKLSCGCLK